MLRLVACEADGAAQDIGVNVGTEVADVGMVVDGRAAGVDASGLAVEWGKFSGLFSKGVVQLHSFILSQMLTAVITLVDILVRLFNH